MDLTALMNLLWREPTLDERARLACSPTALIANHEGCTFVLDGEAFLVIDDEKIPKKPIN